MEHHGPRPGIEVAYEIDSVNIAAWKPGPVGDPAKATQVHMAVRVKGLDLPMVIRFHGPDTLGEFIRQLVMYRSYVWPDAPMHLGEVDMELNDLDQEDKPNG